MIILITIIYSISLLYIFLFSLGQLHLTFVYLREKRKKSIEPPLLKEYPLVTVQLPVFNEKYVVERLLDAVSKFNYPKENLEIQVLDDSTDETTQLIRRKIEALVTQGLNIKIIHRTIRKGFKAGALADSMSSVKGEFIAIFDADFVPEPDFLLKTLPYFADSKIGVVQTRWGHLNRDYSILTQLQAFGLDAHFSIEQTGREAAGSFINFNGTCGVWRKSCIEDAGGWQDDTLTEDLDLSYRAQLRGWKFHYLEEVATPGELPVIMPAIKSQQYRWNKGAAETARKNFGKVFLSNLPLQNKIHAFFHLFNSSVFVFLLIAAILSIPMLLIKQQHPELVWLFHAGIIFLMGFFSITFFYWIATKRFYKDAPVKTFYSLFPRFLIVSMGLSFHNGVAVLEGLVGRKTPFIRTPKFNITNKRQPWLGNTYIHTKITLSSWAEALLCLYFIFGIVAGIWFKDGSLIFFHVMLAMGFGSIFYYSVRPSLDA
ncbi:MAG: glycosyltransferase family 2 protein [Cyclobacteriaceae bacterium]|nr:glycosyltransferase family 2 protein [Cyclobacteriaceae bacterium]